ncbi:xanthine dehydrogenase family protein molybdopterin-binding subunit [Rhodovulum sp. 12E13]|uniref:xanthine dehydrogenase family protein molybdopterin-binding subunit n=1 Tax=Rhodovulum sp. 12E13 TaxID=2203891 RepID=UPI000E1B099D|nr:xanthine dehydrogenase family protein molybdopterin-binding subunit [Rhodovulum sp. 12E13]RDC71952.1 xanthine dehydrogenase family protein molybdopterin-binding subunit [Rhodovulum sp. 12E13]
MNTPNTYIGGHVERVEDARFLRGAGRYIDDVTREGMLHACVVRSAVAHGRLVSIDAEEALAMPGVHAVLTAADVTGEIPTIPFRRPNPKIGPYAQPVIARERVRYFGEPVALVLADSPELAEDAAELVLPEIEPLPAVVTRDAALAAEPLLFPGTTEDNLAAVFTAGKGDAEAAFAGAALVVGDSFSTQRQTALPLETRGLLAEWDADAQHLTVHGAAKLPFFNRRAMAKMMDLPETSVDYVEHDVGGGFGARGEFYPEDFLVALAARITGRPVKWVEDRREHFAAIAHSREAEAQVELALDASGRILGLRGEMFMNVGAYVRPNGMTPVRNCAQFMSGPYRVPNIALQATAYVANKTPAGTFRGPGRYEGSFFIERLLDMAAARLGLDRRTIRQVNLLTNAEMPYPLAQIRPSDGSRAETSCDSGEYSEAFHRCLQAFDWEEKEKLDGRLIDGRYHGIAVSCFIEGGASGPAETARIQVAGDGGVEVYVGSSAIGQGLETVMAQIAADTLGLPMECIRIYHGSTTYLAEGWGSYGSRATVMGGNAVREAALALLARFRALAARRLGVGEAEVSVVGGQAVGPDGAVLDLADLAAEGLAGEAKFLNSDATYTNGTAAVHVAVDPETGRVEVLDYVVCDEVGRIVNALTLHGQVTGAAVQGFGSVFGEELPYDDDGALLVGTLADYLVPLATDYPRVRCLSLESYPSPTNPLGAKGAGEGGIIPVGGAVANAVASALRAFGVAPNHLPLSPARVWALLNPPD